MKSTAPSIKKQGQDLVKLFDTLCGWVQNLQALLKDLPVAIDTLDRLIQEYSAQRIVLFRRELAERKLGWCTWGIHEKPFPLQELKAMLVWTAGDYDMMSSSHSDDYYQIFRVCPEHHKHLLTRPPCRKSAFPIKSDKGNLLYRKQRGVWQPVPSNATKLLEAPEEALFQFPALAQEFNIPGETIALWAKMNLVLSVGGQITDLSLVRKLSRPEFEILWKKLPKEK